jgi:alkanesulfonate monooxygenase SsuD/methylene tetrahydromethanopterin reductase-like flavin-dependent oxidoreductase (luciferase family)
MTLHTPTPEHVVDSQKLHGAHGSTVGGGGPISVPTHVDTSAVTSPARLVTTHVTLRSRSPPHAAEQLLQADTR